MLDNEITNDQIFDWFKESFVEIREESNIPLEIIDDNEHEDGGINFYLGYVGPLGGFGNNKKVKVDISRSERLEFEPVVKNAIVDYSDVEDYKLLCYPLEELLIEKLRCTMQRTQPRDYYDIWYLVEIEKMEIEYYTNQFRNKCTSKELKPEDFHAKLEQKLSQYNARWKKSMSDQIKDLPDFEEVQREVRRKIKNFMV